jgi:hypothetical protein
MDDKRYWFPVRPASNGWGWGLPQVWQGWVILVGFLVLLIGGLARLASYGQLVSVGYSCVLAGLLIGIVAWKGEPQSMRHRR